jgi:hypothetical protein
MRQITTIKLNDMSSYPNIVSMDSQTVAKCKRNESANGDLNMTTFIHSNHSTRHVGAERFGVALDNAQNVRRSLTGTRGLATLLLSAVAAAVMVVAYQVMDSVAEGHLLVMWVALWATAFAALALFSGVARVLAVRTKAGLDDWSRSLAEARADQRLWASARSDARVMADLQCAIDRASILETPEIANTDAGREVYSDTVKAQLRTMSVRAQRLARYY